MLSVGGRETFPTVFFIYIFLVQEYIIDITPVTMSGKSVI